MKYKQLDKKMKDQIDILLSIGYSMRKAARKLNISHSTISTFIAHSIWLYFKLTLVNPVIDLLRCNARFIWMISFIVTQA
ncbi:helix-turn-helix domain-containing protein, partial [Erysipelothrix rhusiopathiae]|nr:helix-turn-helix domain-containing protein [Erysipelothrix rhusiopathiae]